MKSISKSRFISGVQCRKKVWFDYHRKDLKLPVDEKTQQIFDLGHRIGNLAWERFPGGKDASPEDYTDFSKSIANTKEWIAAGVENIYEATFQAENVMSMLDILHLEGNDLWAIEVKNSTSVKDYHYWDAALQYWVMTKAGYQPQKFFLMHIDNQYVKNGDVTPDLFHLADITLQVIELQNWVTENVTEILKVVNTNEEPSVSIREHCGNPFDCDYQHHCWKHVPEHSVFELSRAGKKAWALYDEGILRIEDIPADYPLTYFQTLQYEGLTQNKLSIDKESIENFINNWKFPLYFFDFETIMPAIPVLDGTRPYQQVPFQYSLHVMEEDGKTKHYEFLARPEDFTNGKEDPRWLMIQRMKSHLGTTGSIVTYNQAFEKTRLSEMANDFPDEADFLHGITDRIVDLMVVFKRNWYYHPAMGKSYSIKAVLPAIAPELSYDHLDISDGGTASQLFLDSVENKNFTTPDLEKQLLAYCEQDTYGMVVLHKFLRNL